MAKTEEFRYNIKLGLDQNDFKNGINQAMQSLEKLINMSKEDMSKSMFGKIDTVQFGQIRRELKDIGSAFQSAFDTSTGTMNIDKFTQSLAGAGLSIGQVEQRMKSLGPTGEAAFKKMAASMINVGYQAKATNATLDKMWTTLKNTAKWRISAGLLNNLVGSVQSAVGYVEKLDRSLNDIRIVTGKSSDEMSKFADQANKAAKALGTATTNYTNSALIFYQQGLGDKDVKNLTDLTVKLSNVTGLSAEDASSYVTAVTKGYQVASENAEQYMDVLANVAAHTASNLEQLATGMSKVASAANLMGVSEEQLAGQLSTIVSATQQDASIVGTALKTIYGRINDINAGSDEAEVSLGKYSSKMAELGFNVLDTSGKLRNTGEVMEEIGANWDNLSKEQQVSLAKTMAGLRQYNNLLALFENWDQYEAALGYAENSAGALEQQQKTYEDSIAASKKRLQASAEGLYQGLFDADAMKGWNKVLSLLIDGIAWLSKSFGGLIPILLTVGGALTRLFSGRIASEIINFKAYVNDANNSLRNLQTNIQAKYGKTFASVMDDDVKALAKSADIAQEAITRLGDSAKSQQIAKNFDVLKTKFNAKVDAEAMKRQYYEGAGSSYGRLLSRFGETDKKKIKEQSQQFVTGLGMQKTTNVGQDIYDSIEQLKGFKIGKSKTMTLSTSVEQFDKALEEGKIRSWINNDNGGKNRALQAGISEKEYNRYIKDLSDLEGGSLSGDAAEQAQNRINQIEETFTEYWSSVSEDFHSVESTIQAIILHNKEMAENAKKTLSEYGFKKDNGEIDEAAAKNKIEEAKESLAILDKSGKHNKQKTAEIQKWSQDEGFTKFAEKQGVTAKDLDNFENAEDSAKQKIIEALRQYMMMLANSVEDIPKGEEANAMKKAAEEAGIKIDENMEANDIDSGIHENAHDADVDFKTEQKAQDSGNQKINTMSANFEQIGKIVGGVMQLSAALSQLDSIINVIQDDSMSTGQKVLKLLPMIISFLSTTFFGVQALIPAFTSAGAAGAAAGTATSVAFAPITAIILGIMAAIAIFIVGFAVISDMIVTQAEAEEVARKKTEELTEAYNNAKDAANEFKDTISSWEDAESALDNLISGTKEYEEALRDANDQARELINKYGLIKGQDWNWDGNKIVINDSAKERVQNRLDANTIRTQGQLESAQAKQMQLSQNIDFKAFVKEFGDEVGNEQAKAIKNSLSNIDIFEQSDEIENFVENRLKELENPEFDASQLEKPLEDQKVWLKKIQNDTNAIRNKKTESTESEYVAKLMQEKGWSEQTSKLVAQMTYNNEELLDSTDLESQYNQTIGNFSNINRINDIYSAFYKLMLDENISDELRNNYEAQANKFETYKTKYGNKEGVGAAYAIQEGYTEGSFKIKTNDSDKNKLDITSAQSGEVLETINIEDAAQYLFLQSWKDSQQSEQNIQARYNLASLIEEGKASSGQRILSDALSNKQINFNSKNFSLEQLKGFENYQTEAESYSKMNDNEQKNKAKEWADRLGIKISDLETAFGDEWVKKFLDQIVNGLADIDTGEWAKNMAKAAAQGLEAGSALMSDLTSGKVTSDNIEENENFINLRNQLDQLKGAYPELQVLAEELNNTWAAGTQEYLDVLEAVQEEFSAIEIEAKSIDFSKTFEDFKENLGEVKTLTEDLENQLQDLFDKDWEINVSIKKELQREIDAIVSRLEGMESAASKIGKNFKVSYEDIEAVAQAFPGILDNYKVLADGTIQLSQQATAVAMEEAQKIAKQKQEDAIADLERDIATLESKKTIYLSMATLFDEYAAGRMEASKLISKTNGELNKLESINDGIASEQKIKNAAEVTTNASENAGVLANNWRSAYQAAAKYSAQFASAAVANNKAATGTDAGAVQNVTLKDLYSSTSGTEGQVTDLSNTIKENINNSDASREWAAAQARMFRNQAAEIDNMINSAYGSIAKIKGLGNKTKTTMQDSASGKGHDDKNSDKDPDKKDFLEEQADLYHDIDIEIKRVEKSLERLEKAEDRLKGVALVENLNKQLQELNQSLEEYNGKLNIALNRASTLQVILKKAGAKFDETGNISNYSELMQKQINKYDNVIKWYNNLSASDQSEQSTKDKLEEAKKAWEKFQEDLKEYEEIINDTTEELIDKIEETLEKKIEIQIKKFRMTVEISAEFVDSQKAYNEFQKKVVEGIKDSDSFGNLQYVQKDILVYLDSDLGTIPTNIKAINDIVAEIEKMNNGGHSSVYSAFDEQSGKWVDDMSQAYEDLKASQQSVQDGMIEIISLQDEAHNKIVEAISAVGDAYDALESIYELLNSQIQHNISMVGLIYGEEAYEQMSKYYNKQVELDKKRASSQISALRYWKQEFDKAYADFQNGLISEEQFVEIQNQFTSAVESANSIVEQWAQDVIDKYKNTVNQIFANLEKELTGGYSFDWLSNQLERDFDDTFLDEINRLYSLQDLNLKWSQALDENSSLFAQEKLNAARQEELKMLEEKEFLTKYDVERAEKVLDITKKQIALQEAQQNKSKMRLRRDANGNYSYQFVADNDQIDKAREDLAKAENDLYNFDKNAYENNLEESLKLAQEFVEQKRAIYEDYTLSREEQEKRIVELDEWYQNKSLMLTQQNSFIISNLEKSSYNEYKALTKTAVIDWQDMTREQKRAMLEELVPAVNDGIQTMVDRISESGGLADVTKKAFAEMTAAAKEEEIALEAIGRMSQTVGSIVKSEEAKMLESTQNTIEAKKKEKDAIEEISKAIDDLATSYKNAASAAAEAAQKMVTEMSKVTAAATSANAAIVAAKKAAQGVQYSSIESTVDKGDSSGDSSGGNKDSSGDVVETPSTYKDEYFILPNDGVYLRNIDSKGAIVKQTKVSNSWKTENPARHFVRSDASAIRGDSGYYFLPIVNQQGQIAAYVYVYGAKSYNDVYHKGIRGKKISELGDKYAYFTKTFDTGGYTGAWGSDGRLALLHEKELVLNKADTANILKAVDVMRGVVQNIGSASLQKVAEIGSSSLNSSKMVSRGKEAPASFEQTVKIDANFPAVKNAIEIEQALNNLTNLASQKITKFKR